MYSRRRHQLSDGNTLTLTFLLNQRFLRRSDSSGGVVCGDLVAKLGRCAVEACNGWGWGAGEAEVDGVVLGLCHDGGRLDLERRSNGLGVWWRIWLLERGLVVLGCVHLVWEADSRYIWWKDRVWGMREV